MKKILCILAYSISMFGILGFLMVYGSSVYHFTEVLIKYLNSGAGFVAISLSIGLFVLGMVIATSISWFFTLMLIGSAQSFTGIYLINQRKIDSILYPI